MAFSSFSPMRRKRISWRPSLALKYHLRALLHQRNRQWPLFFANDDGGAVRVRLGDLDAVLRRGLFRKSLGVVLVLDRIVRGHNIFTVGPKIASSSGTSKSPAALIRASAACCGVSKPFWAAAAVLAAGCA